MLKRKWKKIKGFPNYKVSNYGEIYSKKSKKLLKPFFGVNKKTLYVHLYKNGETKCFNLARLVVKYFNNEWTWKKSYALHVDYNRLNNKETNLETATRGDLLRYWNTYKNRIRGIYHFPHGKKKYRAVIKHNDKAVTIGYYNNPLDAMNAFRTRYLKLYKIEPYQLTA